MHRRLLAPARQVSKRISGKCFEIQSFCVGPDHTLTMRKCKIRRNKLTAIRSKFFSTISSSKSYFNIFAVRAAANISVSLPLPSSLFELVRLSDSDYGLECIIANEIRYSRHVREVISKWEMGNVQSHPLACSMHKMYCFVVG